MFCTNKKKGRQSRHACWSLSSGNEKWGGGLGAVGKKRLGADETVDVGMFYFFVVICPGDAGQFAVSLTYSQNDSLLVCRLADQNAQLMYTIVVGF